MGVSNTTYKQTELGLIPQDWEVKTISEVAEIVGGGTPSTFNANFWNGQINWFTPTEVGYSKFLFESRRKISDLGFKSINSKLLAKGTILLTTRAGIGDVGILTLPSCTNQGFQSLIVKQNSNNEFLYYLIQTKKNILLQNASGSTFLEISPNKIKQIQIPIPPLAEQTAIANTISDVDNLIDSLEKLIQKKKRIKQGALQRLLKPKKDWTEFEIGSICEIFKGSNLSKSKVNINGGNYKCILYGDLFTTYNEVIKSVNTFTNFDEGVSSKKGDILFPGSTTTKGIDLAKSSTILLDNVRLGGDIIILRKKNFEYNSIFLSYFINQEKRIEIGNLAKGITIHHLYGSDLKGLIVSFPNIDKQEEIADILTDMDNEIELLQSKLLKYQQVKQGMMQNLLTGKIRLVNTESKQTKIAKPKVESTEKKQGHNKQINEAVIISVLVHRYANEKFALSRFRYTKYLYLLHRHIERKAEGFLKKAAGPYNPSNRYGGPEKIALGNKYIKTQNNGFVADTNIEQAIQYFNEWYDMEHLNWLDAFKFSKNEHLEVLTTVDMAIDELIKENKEPNLSNVKSMIATNKEWKPKLEKPFFNDFEIQNAITESLNLFYNN